MSRADDVQEAADLGNFGAWREDVLAALAVVRAAQALGNADIPSHVTHAKLRAALVAFEEGG